MNGVFTKEWWIAAGIRAIKTMAQTAIATIGVSAVMQDVNWIAVGSASLLSGILSLLMSISGLPEVPDTTSDSDVGKRYKEDDDERTDKA